MTSLAIGVVLAVAAFALSWLLTAAVRRFALHSGQLLDVPGSRSSHTVATPRGGGLAFVLSFAAVASVWVWQSHAPRNLMLSLMSSSLLVALAGFIDDRHSLSARLRFVIHLVAAILALTFMPRFPDITILGLSFDPGWIGPLVAVLYLVWLVNLYNFMDGIDGIASIEAVTVALGGAACWWLATGTPHWLLPTLLASSVAGFLLWNFPRARIFMGDVGSGFIGMAVGVFSLWTAHESAQVFWSWFILLGCFIVDATTTLVRRVLRGEAFHEAHRNHAYQYASRRHGSHWVVSLTTGAINLFWLLPIAMLVALRIVDGIAAAAVAFAPLLALAFRYRAGDRRSQEV